MHGDDVVAFASHAVRIPLPKVASYARGKEASDKLKALLRQLGVPGLQSETIVKSSISVRPGGAPLRSMFMGLARALRQVVS